MGGCGDQASYARLRRTLGNVDVVVWPTPELPTTTGSIPRTSDLHFVRVARVYLQQRTRVFYGHLSRHIVNSECACFAGFHLVNSSSVETTVVTVSCNCT